MRELSARILVIEEDPTLGVELKHALEHLGCDVVVVRDGPKGLARAVTDRFDAVVLDTDLPRMNGFRVCRRIREDARARATPLFLMGDGAELASHDKSAMRADVYFAKPVVIAELVAGLKNVLALNTTSKMDAIDMSAAIAKAEAESGLLVELRKRLAEQDAAVARLTSELDAAKKEAAKAAERAALPKPPLPKPSLPSMAKASRPPQPTPATDLRELARQREDIARLEAALAAARTEKTKAHADEMALLRAELAAVRNDLSEMATTAQEHKVALDVKRQEYTRAEAALKAEVDALAAEIAKRDRDAQQLREASEARVKKVTAEQRERHAAALEKHAVDIAELEKSFEAAVAVERAALETERARVRSLEAKIAEAARASKEIGIARQAALEAAKAVSAERQARLRAEKRTGDLERAAADEKRAREAALVELEGERNAHAASRGELATALAVAEEQRSARAELEAGLVEQQTALESFHRDVMDAHTENGELEAEIAVLRGELTNVRRELDHESIANAALEAELERGREMLRHARTLLEPEKP